MPVRGKDGSYYDSVDELMRANAQWEQREKQNELLKEQNRIAQQQLQIQQQVIQQQELEQNQIRKQDEIKRQKEREEIERIEA